MDKFSAKHNPGINRILVTGAAGFIGSYVYSDLIRLGYDVVGLDFLTNSYSPDLKKRRIENLKNRELLDNQIQFIDISDKNSVNDLLGTYKFDSVIHLAAQAGVRTKIGNYDSYITANLVGFSNVLEASVLNKVSNFLFASSSSVYGENSPTPFSEEQLYLEPKSFYGGTKLANEVLARSVTNIGSMKMRALRFFSVYGPWGRPDMAYFRILESLLNNHDFKVYGDGSIKRDFTFIEDVVSTTIALLCQLNKKTLSNKKFDIVNVGGGNPVSIIDLVKIFELYLDKKLPIKFMNGNESDVKITIADRNYRDELIGKSNFVVIQEGIRRFIDWGMHEVDREDLKHWVSSTL